MRCALRSLKGGHTLEKSTSYLNKARQCLRLAATIVTRDDQAVPTLLALSAEFEALAVESAMRETEAVMARSRASCATSTATTRHELS
jgi:hypothetical protein